MDEYLNKENTEQTNNKFSGGRAISGMLMEIVFHLTQSQTAEVEIQIHFTHT